MSTSGTYTFNPSPGELTIYAYQLIGIRPTALLQEHMDSARTAMNMMLASWSNRGVNLWQVTKTTTALTAGVATYTVDPATVVILDAYVQSGNPAIDRIIMPVSRTEYASYPNKAQEGFPTVFWMDRTLSPTVTLWPVPDGSQTDLVYYSVLRIQDTNMNGTQEVDIPPIWLEAFAYGLATRLAMIWAPDKVIALKPFADEAYETAATQNIETANQYISPVVSGYWR